MKLIVIQVIDGSPAGHTVRLSDGSVRMLERHPGESPTVGTEVEEVHPGLVQHVSQPEQAGTTIERVNSEEQVLANVLSQAVNEPEPPLTGEQFEEQAELAAEGAIEDSGTESQKDPAVSVPEQPEPPTAPE